MATKITAYRGDDGKLYESQEAAEKEELLAAVKYLAGLEESHLSNVAFGHSQCAMTRNAIELIARRLPAVTRYGYEADNK